MWSQFVGLDAITKCLGEEGKTEDKKKHSIYLFPKYKCNANVTVLLISSKYWNLTAMVWAFSWQNVGPFSSYLQADVTQELTTLSTFQHVYTEKIVPSLLSILVNDEKCHHSQLHIFSSNQMAEVCSKNNSVWQLIFLPSGVLHWSVAMKAISMLMKTEAFMIQSETCKK